LTFKNKKGNLKTEEKLTTRGGRQMIYTQGLVMLLLNILGTLFLGRKFGVEVALAYMCFLFVFCSGPLILSINGLYIKIKRKMGHE